VFGRVVGGFEHIQTIGRLPVGEKHRPLSTVMIAHCGELELRKPAAKKVSPERSVSPAKRRSKRSDSVEEKRPRKEVKERRKKKREETEEELDAR